MRFILTFLLVLALNLELCAQIKTVKRTSTPLSKFACSKDILIYSPNFCDEKDDFKYFKWDEFSGLKHQARLKYDIIDFYLFKDGRFRAIIPYRGNIYSFGANKNKKYFFIRFQFLNQSGRLLEESNEVSYLVKCGSGNIEIEGSIDNNLYGMVDYVQMSTKGCFFGCK